MKKFIVNTAGMSLIEITFAMGILATALSLLFGSLISITVISRLNEEKAVANTALSTVLEELRTLPLADLLTYVPEVPDHPGNDRTILLECYDADGAPLELPLPQERDDAGKIIGPLPDLPNPLEVRATLLWTNSRGNVFKTHVTTSVGR